MKKFLLPVLGLVALFSALSLNSGAEAQAPSEEALVLARELLEVSGAADQMSGMMDILSPIIVQSIRSEVPSLSVEQQQDIARIFVEEFVALTPQTLENLAVLYAESYSAEDMQAAISFFRSESGQRFVAATPAIMEVAQRIGEAAGRQAATNAMPRIQSYLEQ
tara:strand:+ start:1847 stop:2338 length:492 start_codon:yes stop_codon:yes gene_type:complete